MPRRGANIYKRKDGRWEGRIRKEEQGGRSGRKYIYVYGKTYKETKGKMEEVKKEARTSRPAGKYTLEEAVDLWFTEKRSCWKQTTYAAYHHMVNKYILPKLGKFPLEQIDGTVIEKFLADIRTEKDEKGLSGRYLRNICAALIRIMRYVKKRKYYEIEIPENPVPTVKQGGRMLPKEQELASLENYLLGHADSSTCLGILTALYTGLRIGEVCALKWEDINLEEGIIYVKRNLQRTKAADGQKNNTQILFQTPKTGASLREVPIPPVLLSLLKEQQEEEDQYIIKGKKKPWAEPRTLQYRFVRILKECKVERFNFHMLRHAFATRCMACGFDVKSLSEILGHSSIQVTLSLYVHSDMQRKKGLMGKFTCSMYQRMAS